MPLYDFLCPKAHAFERFVRLEDFSSPQLCSCGAVAVRVISAPMFIVDNVGYTCPVTDEWIGSKSAHKENLAKHNSRVLETGENEINIASRQKADEAFERKVDQTIEREIDAMPSAKREQLHNELVNGGLTAEVVRN